MSNFQRVKKFMLTFGQEVKEKAEFPENKITSLRYELIQEELLELKEAIDKKDIKEVADALTDILYVTYGAGHAFGINLDKCFEEVQNSNMSKLGKDGKPIYNEKGKVMKGPDYFEPNLNKFVSIHKFLLLVLHMLTCNYPYRNILKVQRFLQQLIYLHLVL